MMPHLHLRLQEDVVIILDSINRLVIDEALNKGIKTFVAGNCTVSLMLMSLGGLFYNYQELNGYQFPLIQLRQEQVPDICENY